MIKKKGKGIASPFKARSSRSGAGVATTASESTAVTGEEVEENFDELGLDDPESEYSEEEEVAQSKKPVARVSTGEKAKSTDTNDQMMKMLEQMQKSQLKLMQENKEMKEQIGTMMVERSSAGGGSFHGSEMEEEVDDLPEEGEVETVHTCAPPPITPIMQPNLISTKWLILQRPPRKGLLHALYNVWECSTIFWELWVLLQRP